MSHECTIFLFLREDYLSGQLISVHLTIELSHRMKKKHDCGRTSIEIIISIIVGMEIELIV